MLLLVANILYNMLLQLSKVCGFERAHFEMFIERDAAKRTREGVRLVSNLLFVTSVRGAKPLFESIVNMMLSSDLVSQHTSTETTLVSDNKQVRGRSDSMI